MFLPKLVLYIYPVQMLEDTKGVLDASKETPNNLKRKSAKIIKFSKIRVLRYNCQWCFTEHSCQDQHISHGGCIEQISWSEQVIEYFIRRVLESLRMRGC